MKWIIVVVVVVHISLISADDVNLRYEVVCPPFEDNGFVNNNTPFQRASPRMRSAEDEYCQCSVTEHGTTRAAIIKCDFGFGQEMDIILKGSLFPFRSLNITSAYIRMRNTRSATITSDFLSSWMNSPSSALDLWQCGKVVIESTPDLKEHQRFPVIRTFVGVGIIDCSLESLPSPFLRDRSRGAMRLKGCTIGKLNAGIFRNIDEVRYLNFEDSVIKEVTGPLSSSGVITLSKKEIHSWDGIEVINSTFEHVAPYSFNVTHKDILEKFFVKKSKFGKLETGAISITGDLNASFTNCSFNHLDSLAIQITVSGRVLFTQNVIREYTADSLRGLTCVRNSALGNNTFYVSTVQSERDSSQLKSICGESQMFYISKPPQQESQSSRATTSSIIAIIVILVLLVVAGMFLWGWRNRALLRYHYKRNDTPLWKEELERAHDREEEPCPETQNKTAFTIVQSQDSAEQHSKY